MPSDVSQVLCSRNQGKNEDLSFVRRDLLGNVAILLDNNAVALLGRLDGVGLVVDVLEFFEGTALGLDTARFLDQQPFTSTIIEPEI